MHPILKKKLALFLLTNCYMAPSLFAENAVPLGTHSLEQNAPNFSISAFYTYWVPYQDVINVAITSGSATVQGGVIAPAMNGQSGFKLNACASTTHDGWMVRLNYAWFNNQPSLEEAAVASTPYISYYGLLPLPLYNAFSTCFQNQFNRIDSQLDREFFAGNYFVFRPWLGLLAAWDQEYLNIFQTTPDVVGSSNFTEEIKIHQNWWGIGPYAGCVGSYYFTNEFCGYISSGLGMLLSNHKITTTYFNTNSSVIPIGRFAGNFNEYNNMEPMLEASLGVRWEKMWTTWGLSLDLSWETQTYFSHANLTQQGTGNYSMQGLTAGLIVSF